MNQIIISKIKKNNYIGQIIVNQQLALGALGLENNSYDPIYARPASNVMSNLIEGIKVGQSFYNVFSDFADNLNNPTVFEVLDEMEFSVDDAIDFVKSNIL